MPRQININADMGESYGSYRIGDDAALLRVVKNANVACGFHGGDARVMRETCLEAKEHGVSVGAHPSFDDRWGFGRRRIDMAPADLEYMVAYQIGALNGMAAYAGIRVTHVKPHGALSNMAAENADYARAIGQAMKTVDPGLIFLALTGSEMARAAVELGIPLALEAFIDRQYEDDGNLQSRKVPGSVITDPALAAERAVRMVLDGEIVSAGGRRMPTAFQSLCVHGDEPTGVAVAEAARHALEAAGVEIVTLPEAMAAR